MTSSILDSYEGHVQSLLSKRNEDVFTFKAKVTVSDKNVGAACKVHLYEKETGNLISISETDSNSYVVFLGVPKKLSYFIVAFDKTGTYSSVLFDIDLTSTVNFENDILASDYRKYISSTASNFVKNLNKEPVIEEVEDDLLFAINNPSKTLDNTGSKWYRGTIQPVEDDLRPLSAYVRSTSNGAFYSKGLPFDPTSSFTFEINFELSVVGSSSYIFNYVPATSTLFRLKVETDLKVGLYINNALKLKSSSSLSLDTRHNVTLTYNGSIFNLYVDGVSQGSFVFSYNTLSNSNFAVLSGIEGYIYSFYIYKSCKYIGDFTPKFDTLKRTPTHTLEEGEVFKLENRPAVLNTSANSKYFNKYSLDTSKGNLRLQSIVAAEAFILDTNFILKVAIKKALSFGVQDIISNFSSKTDTQSKNGWFLRFDSGALKFFYNLKEVRVFNAVTIPREFVYISVVKIYDKLYFYYNGQLDSVQDCSITFDTQDAADLFIELEQGSQLEYLSVYKKKNLTLQEAEENLDLFHNEMASLPKDRFEIVHNYFESLPVGNLLNYFTFFKTNNILITPITSYYNRNSAYFSTSSFETIVPFWYSQGEDFTINLIASFEEIRIEPQTLMSIYPANLESCLKIGSVNNKIAVFINGSWLEFIEYESGVFYNIILQREGSRVVIILNGNRIDLGEIILDIDKKVCNIFLGNYNSTEYFKGYLNCFELMKGYSLYKENFDFPTSIDLSYKDIHFTIVDSNQTSTPNFFTVTMTE